MILEGIVTTTDASGAVNVSPMGPIVDEAMQMFVLRPFQSSRTYQNLKRHAEGVLHVVDDVLLLARAAIGRIDPPPSVRPAQQIDGFVLDACCRWYEFQVDRLDDAKERTTIECRVVAKGRHRDFFGFNRAKHAILEIAILATRIGIISDAEIRAGVETWRVLVEKTGGEQENQALSLLAAHIESGLEIVAADLQRDKAANRS